MENINDIELKAYDNLFIGRKERLLANELKRMAKSELKKAKAREGLLKRQLEVAGIREHIAKENNKIVKKKLHPSQLFPFRPIVKNC